MPPLRSRPTPHSYCCCLSASGMFLPKSVRSPASVLLRSSCPPENWGEVVGGGKGRQEADAEAGGWAARRRAVAAAQHHPVSAGKPWGSCCTRTPGGTSSGETSGTTTWYLIVSVRVPETLLTAQPCQRMPTECSRCAGHQPEPHLTQEETGLREDQPLPQDRPAREQQGPGRRAAGYTSAAAAGRPGCLRERLPPRAGQEALVGLPGCQSEHRRAARPVPCPVTVARGQFPW